jgi:predicted ribosome-associated RNA-binding protein Tma20
MNEFEVVISPIIMLATWLICYIAKKWIVDKDKKIIPTIAAVTGLIIGILTISMDLNGAVTGVLSGLAATGLNELVKQFKKDTTITEGE